MIFSLFLLQQRTGLFSCFFVAVFSYFLKFLISHYFVSLILSSFLLSLVITFPFLCVNHFISAFSDEMVAEAS